MFSTYEKSSPMTYDLFALSRAITAGCAWSTIRPSSVNSCSNSLTLDIAKVTLRPSNVCATRSILQKATSLTWVKRLLHPLCSVLFYKLTATDLTYDQWLPIAVLITTRLMCIFMCHCVSLHTWKSAKININNHLQMLSKDIFIPVQQIMHSVHQRRFIFRLMGCTNVRSSSNLVVKHKEAI